MRGRIEEMRVTDNGGWGVCVQDRGERETKRKIKCVHVSDCAKGHKNTITNKIKYKQYHFKTRIH